MAPTGGAGHLLILWHGRLHGFVDVPVRNEFVGTGKAVVQQSIVHPAGAVGCHDWLLPPSVGWRKMVRGSQRQEATRLSQGGSSWALGNTGMEALSQEVFIFSGHSPSQGVTRSFQNPAVPPRIRLLSGFGGRKKGRTTPPTPRLHNPSARGTPNRPPAAPCPPRDADRLGAFVWVV